MEDKEDILLSMNPLDLNNGYNNSILPITANRMIDLPWDDPSKKV